MAKRIIVGISFEHSEDWIGGTYYFQNLVHCLNFLPEPDQPVVKVLSWEVKDYEILNSSGYRHLKFLDLNFTPGLGGKLINAVSGKLLNQRVIKGKLKADDVDVIYPGNFLNRLNIFRHLHWIPDFQDLYYPDFFSAEELRSRKEERERLIKSARPVVFSSACALTDFKNHFPSAVNTGFVLRFAVNHPEFQSLDGRSLLNKFGISSKFLMVPNQFWKHKNQKVVLEAAGILADRKIDVQLVFTGREHDYRNPEYFASLKKIVEDHDLGRRVKFLGFIDRREQLKLMSESLAIIQPSLFEGWSTVVEDAKALNKFLIASDLPVHREQIINNCLFFDPKNPEELADGIERIIKEEELKIIKSDYQANRVKFATDFVEILNKVI